MYKPIYQIEIKDDIDDGHWYNEFRGELFYAVKSRVNGILAFEVINELDFKGNYIKYDDAMIIDLVTKVVLPMY